MSEKSREVITKITTEFKRQAEKPQFAQAMQFSPLPELTSKEYLQSFDELQKRASVGNSNAQLMLGMTFCFGWHGQIINEREGHKWILKAKQDVGSPVGVCALGLCHARAIGGIVISDYNKAKEYYAKAGDSGYIPALFCMASNLYCDECDWEQENGNNVPRKIPIWQKGDSPQEDIKRLAEKCVKEGFVPAHSILGHSYYKGYGYREKPDFQKSLKHGLIAAEAGVASARNLVGMLYFSGQGTKKDLKEARKWLQLAADQNHPQAGQNLARLNLYESIWCVIM